MPMRHVKLSYDCAYCGKRGIAVQELDTDLPDDELIKRVAHNAVCTNPVCPEKGVPQEAMEPTIIVASPA